MAIRDANCHAAVIDVYDYAVIAYIPILQEQVGKICAPFLVGFLRSEVLFELVFKYFMGFPGFCTRLSGAGNGAQL